MSKVSIIMGVYNCKDKSLLKNSVESIINQTYTDWEFIICNDGSTDDTLNYLYEIEKLDNRIRIVSYKENRGLSYALNYSLNVASGEYIARQDDDDYSYPNRLERQVQYMIQHPEIDIVGCLADVYDDTGIWGKYSVVEKPENKDFLWNSPFNHPTTVFRTSSLLKVGGYRTAKETRRCEDYDLFMRMYAAGFRGRNLQEILYKYWIKNDATKKYRPMKYRIDEAVVRYKGYKALHIMIPGCVFVLKPIVIGFIPQRLFRIIRGKQY